jgi:colicin import membrane protein/SWI/SNF-related matrix-associated actin-dependent regulator 1 of chromatin subfamily A
MTRQTSCGKEENMEIENTNLDMEQSADQYDAFLEGWGDDVAPVTESEADQPAEETESEAEVTEETEVAEAESEAEAKETPTEETTAEAEQTVEPVAPALWEVKHMGEKRSMTAADITPELLQKGLDYDRIRSKYDESKPVTELMAQFAKKANMSITEYVKIIRTEALRAGGMSEDEAARSVALEDREAAVAAAEAEQRERAEAEAKVKSRVDADLAEFAKAFPDVYKQAESDPKAIPESVWAQVNSGALSLTAAYSRYAVEQANASAAAAREAAAAEVQNAKNAARSTGSMQSAGNDNHQIDPFDEGWYSSHTVSAGRPLCRD